MINKGFIAINKPKGWTSFDVVNKIKHMLKPLKVGHLGTLDPMATGVMLISVGKATKLFDFMQNKLKTYIAEFEFGYETNTLDATGEIIDKTTNIPTLEEIKLATKKQIGQISQIPPQFSAKMCNGKRAYDLARKGQDFELKPKMVLIEEIKIISYSNNILKLEITCGSGTYIRSICRDIANDSNSKATMISLVRTKVDDFTLENCSNIEEIDKDNISNFIKKIDEVIKLEKLDLTTEETKRILNGQKIKCEYADGVYKINNENDVLAIVEVKNFIAKMLIFLEWLIDNKKEICYNTIDKRRNYDYSRRY